MNEVRSRDTDQEILTAALPAYLAAPRAALRGSVAV